MPEIPHLSGKDSAAMLRRIAFVAFALLTAAASAQRLPETVAPLHYDLEIEPDLARRTFSGRESIDVNLTRDTDSVILNALDLQFQSVEIIALRSSQPAQVTIDEGNQQVKFSVRRRLRPGHITIKIAYSGILGEKLRGLYYSRDRDRDYVVSQFEPCDARRAFPSFDEPAYKASFALTVVIPQDKSAISNMGILTDVPVADFKKHIVRFQTTPKMSTYLLAILIGDFQCLSGSTDGIRLRVCGVPGKLPYAHFAMSAAQYTLHYYNSYLKRKYPLEKLDLIGLPDFEAGAMENMGAITFRDSKLFLDSATASMGDQEEVASVVAHEVAHQWFGDLVTMNWWNDLWLSEGLATWMENKPLETWKPGWNLGQDVIEDLNSALIIDAQASTHAIRVDANTPDEINQVFDEITYRKAAAVLNMVENYVGSETFRRGLGKYLDLHRYGAATAADFWNVLAEVSRKPVNKIFETFVTLPGEPLLTLVRSSGWVDVSQQRLNATNEPVSGQPPAWAIPVCDFNTSKHARCELLTQSSQQFRISDTAIAFPDSGGVGYFRTVYSPQEYATMLSLASTRLRPSEKVKLLGNEAALAFRGLAKAGDFLSLAEMLRDDDNADVIETISEGVGKLWTNAVASDEDRLKLSRWLDEIFVPRLRAIGPPGRHDTEQKRALRRAVFLLLGNYGDSIYVRNMARELAHKYLSNPGSVDASIAKPAIRIAAIYGDQAYFELLLTTAENSSDPQIAEAARYALAHFSDPMLEERSLDYAVSGKVKVQDAVYQLILALTDVRTQAIAWQYIRERWPAVEPLLTTSFGAYLVESTNAFCSEARRSEVVQFFRSHPIPASDLALRKAEAGISTCITYRQAQGQNLENWLNGKLAIAE